GAGLARGAGPPGGPRRRREPRRSAPGRPETMTTLPPFEASAGRRLVNFEAAVMDRLNAAVIVCDLSGRLIYANPFAERMYGRPASELVGSLAEGLAGVELDPSTAVEIMGELTAGRTWEGEFEVHRPDGTAVTVRASDSGIYDESGRLTGVVSMVTDISDHRQSVDRLSRETRALRFLLDATTVLASSLEFRDCLRRLAELAVPILGDLCFIDVAVNGTVARMAAVHADLALQPLADELATRYPPH